MATIITDTDIIFSVYQERYENAIGNKSIYATTPHPGTGKIIEGWKWDQRLWPTSEEFDSIAIAPSIWDPIASGINEIYWQSGYGDGKDLLLTDIVERNQASGINSWVPEINHGYYYSHDDEWYLYSDSYQTSKLISTNTISGLFYIDLQYKNKVGIPVEINSFYFDKTNLEYTKQNVVKKVIDFSSTPVGPQFKIDYTYSPPRVWVSGLSIPEIGQDVPLTSSGFQTTDLFQLEELGISNGLIDQQFYLSCSPIDESQPVEIFTYLGNIQKWDVITGVDSFSPTSSGIYEARLDPDIGIIEFGDYIDDSTTSGMTGFVPPEGSKIFARYTPTVEVRYEPETTTDLVLGTSANTNPVYTAINKGFIQISNHVTQPASLTLEIENLELIASGYDIELGNNVAKLLATVKDSNEEALEGIEINFEIIGQTVGSFGGVTTDTVAISNGTGNARAKYVSPLTILEVGKASDVLSSGNTILTVEEMAMPAAVNETYTFKIHNDDLVLGIPESDLSAHYTGYLAEEDVTSGMTVSQDWEEDYRSLYSVGVPTTYSTDEEDLIIGKKTLLLTVSGTDITHPHTGYRTPPVLSPLHPTLIENIGTDDSPILEFTYPVALDGIGINSTKAYFVISNTSVQIRAYVFDPIKNIRINSDPVLLNINIPDSANGNYFTSTTGLPGLLTRVRDLNNSTPAPGYIDDNIISQTSGISSIYREYLDESYLTLGVRENYVTWFRRTYPADSAGFETIAMTISGFDPALLPISVNTAGTIPLGFRFKSTGITIGSMLDQVTFLDPNSYLASGYYSV